MRLRRDERKLLAFYARNVKVPNGSYPVNNETLVGWLHLPSEKSLKNIKRGLADKGLISFTHLEKHVEGLIVHQQRVPKEVEPNVTVTREGFDLGMKYNSVFGPSNVWFKEHYKLLMFVIALLTLIVMAIFGLLRL